jgi:hypothetical protein
MEIWKIYYIYLNKSESILDIFVSISYIVVIYTLTSCVSARSGDKIYRDVEIHSGYLNPREVIVPQNVPVILDIYQFDMWPAAVFSNNLSVRDVWIPANPHNPFSVHTLPLSDNPKARVDLGPLKAGSYQLGCHCGNRDDEITVVVK